MHHPQRSQRSFKYCLSSHTRLTFSSESVSESVEGFEGNKREVHGDRQLRPDLQRIKQLVLQPEARSWDAAAGSAEVVTQKSKSVLFLKINAFLSTLHYMLLQDIKITLFPKCPQMSTLVSVLIRTQSFVLAAWLRQINDGQYRTCTAQVQDEYRRVQTSTRLVGHLKPPFFHRLMLDLISAEGLDHVLLLQCDWLIR